VQLPEHQQDSPLLKTHRTEAVLIRQQGPGAHQEPLHPVLQKLP